MTEKHAKKQLERMLKSFSPGSILHLMGDLYRESAEEARQDNDAVAYEQFRLVEHSLVVMGMGVDAACPG